MQKNENPVILAVILLVITGLAALLLGFSNSLTAEKIAENTTKEQNEARMAVLPEASDFKKLDISFEGMVSEVYEGISSGGETVGYAAGISSNGFGGAIEMIVGITADETVSAVKIVSMAETPGLGSKASEPKFNDQFVKKPTQNPLKVIKSGAAKENEVVAISGATITSNAVTNGVNAAIDAVKAISKGGAQNAN